MGAFSGSGLFGTIVTPSSAMWTPHESAMLRRPGKARHAKSEYGTSFRGGPATLSFLGFTTAETSTILRLPASAAVAERVRSVATASARGESKGRRRSRSVLSMAGL